MVTLEPLSLEELTEYQNRVWTLYRSELIQSGLSEAAADENVQQNIANTMPNGVLADGHYVFNVRKNSETVGVVWLADRNGDWFIYDIDINENIRGQGLGRAAMRAIEEFIRAQGGAAISLSVFGFNNVARSLYESEGYEVTRLSMKKTLS